MKKLLLLIITFLKSRIIGQTKEKRMKTLQALAATWLAKNGTDVGFVMKSLKSKKVFNVISKTPKGTKFVIVDVKSGEEFIVDGTAPRYDFNGGGTEAAKLQAMILKLETQRDNLETEISELEDKLAEVEDVG